MKAFINGIQFEGTPQEFAEFISSQKQTDSQPTAVINTPVAQEQKKQETLQDSAEEKYFPGTEEFLSALFRYRPSNTSMGREAYIVKLLTTGKPFTIKQLTRLGRTELHTVKLALKRAVDAGCVINATAIEKNALSVIDSLKLTSKVHMISLGTIEQAKVARKEHEQKNAIFADRKKTLPKQVDTGSAPITKIKYTEGS